MRDVIGIRYFRSTLGSCTAKITAILGLRLGLGLLGLGVRF